MSLYGEYIKERAGKEIIENDKGFVTYVFNKDSVYIENVYVKPDFRKQGITRAFMNEISDIALDRGITKLLGSVVPSANGSTDSLKMMLSCGFKLNSCANDFIVFSKDLLQENE